MAMHPVQNVKDAHNNNIDINTNNNNSGGVWKILTGIEEIGV